MIKYICDHADEQCEGQCFCDLNHAHDVAHDCGLCHVIKKVTKDVRIDVCQKEALEEV